MSLTPDELNILNDVHFLRVKHQLSDKVISYFSSIERALHQEIKNFPDFPFPDGTFLKGGKISKGENYKLLPYFILDYPRLFTQKEIFAFRSMLWWGHHFSCTLQLSGPILDQYKEVIVKNILSDKEIYFCINDQPWDYHFENDNYLKISELTQEDLLKHIEEHAFIKVSVYLDISDWDEFKSFTLKTFARFLQYLY